MYIERGRKREKGEANSSLNEDLREKIEKSLQANRGPSSPHTPHILNCPVIGVLRVFFHFLNQTNSFFIFRFDQKNSIRNSARTINKRGQTQDKMRRIIECG